MVYLKITHYFKERCIFLLDKKQKLKQKEIKKENLNFM